MRFRTRCCGVLAFLMLPLWFAGAQTKAPASKGSASGSAKPATASAPAPKKPTAAATSKAPAKRPVRKVPIGQARPTKERYVEIQQALADAGYFSGPVNGVWNDASVNALRQFQQAQGLEPTGKLDALTLIRLDLGPQYDSQGGTPAAGGNSPG